MANEIRRVVRARTSDERASYAEVRKQVEQEFPSLDPPREPSAKNRIAAAIRKARKDQGLTWDAIAGKASIPDPMTVRDIEYRRDAKLSNVESIARALGLGLVQTSYFHSSSRDLTDRRTAYCLLFPA